MNSVAGIRCEDTLGETIQSALEVLIQSQRVQGYWPDCFDTGAMPNAQTVIALSLLGIEDPDWTRPLLSQILSTQLSDGSWSVYPGGAGDVSTTVECYYALELCGCWDGIDERRHLAEQFIVTRGGLRKCRNLTKMFLAIGGEIPWRWLPSPRLYLLLFSKWFPVHISDFVAFTRLHVAPMLLLSSLQFVEERRFPPVLQSLWLPQDTSAHRRGLPRRLSPTARRRLFRCLQWVLKQRSSDGTVASYHSSSLLLVFTLRALGVQTNHPDIQSVLRALRKAVFVHDTSGFFHQQTCDAYVWNTALAATAMMETHEASATPPVERAIRYLVSKQQTNGETMYNGQKPGGWAFSSNNTTHPDTDDTVACLQALFPYRTQYEKTWSLGVDWLLDRQNQDGGWSAFDQNCNKRWLEWIPANDMKRTMCDPSTPDISGRVVEFLVRCCILQRGDHRLERALGWIRSHQEPDGSWFGRWGTTYLYGTWCAVKALAVAGVPGSDNTLDRAKEWLLKVQRPDGSFGESCESDMQGRFVPLEHGLPTQTAWGLDALLHLYACQGTVGERCRVWAACQRAVHWLLQHMTENTWMEDMPTGSAFPGALHIRYHIYPKVWPLIALSHFRSLATLKGGEWYAGSEVTGYIPWAHLQSKVLAENVRNPSIL